jgi:hypothetical protein
VLTDAQLAILVGAIGASAGSLIAALKWSIGRIVKALDQNQIAFVEFKAEMATHSEVLRGLMRSRGAPTPSIFQGRKPREGL